MNKERKKAIESLTPQNVTREKKKGNPLFYLYLQLIKSCSQDN